MISDSHMRRHSVISLLSSERYAQSPESEILGKFFKDMGEKCEKIWRIILPIFALQFKKSALAFKDKFIFPPPLSLFYGHMALLGGLGECIFEAPPPRRIFLPPSSLHTPTRRRIFSEVGGGGM